MADDILKSMSITITTKRADGHSEIAQIAPQTFFDLDEETTVTSLSDLVWRHNHAIDIINLDASDAGQTILEVRCDATNESITDVELFWRRGTCRSLWRSETKDGVETTWLRILEIATVDGAHFLRFGSGSNNAIGLLAHHIVVDDSVVNVLFDGSGDRRNDPRL